MRHSGTSDPEKVISGNVREGLSESGQRGLLIRFAHIHTQNRSKLNIEVGRSLWSVLGVECSTFGFSKRTINASKDGQAASEASPQTDKRLVVHRRIVKESNAILADCLIGKFRFTEELQESPDRIMFGI